MGQPLSILQSRNRNLGKFWLRRTARPWTRQLEPGAVQELRDQRSPRLFVPVPGGKLQYLEPHPVWRSRTERRFQQQLWRGELRPGDECLRPAGFPAGGKAHLLARLANVDHPPLAACERGFFPDRFSCDGSWRLPEAYD